MVMYQGNVELGKKVDCLTGLEQLGKKVDKVMSRWFL
jgi:hypothetical protein